VLLGINEIIINPVKGHGAGGQMGRFIPYKPAWPELQLNANLSVLVGDSRMNKRKGHC